MSALKGLASTGIKENLVPAPSLKHLNEVSEELASAIKILASLPIEFAR